MSARDDILGRIRTALGRTGSEGPPPAPEYANARLVPARGQGDAALLEGRFIAMAEEAAATVERVGAIEEVAAAVADFVRREALPARLAVAPDAALDRCGWDRESGLAVRRGRSFGDDPVSVTTAVAGIAETGSLMVVSGPATPYTLNFLPDVHIVVLDAKAVVGAYEDAWALVRPRGERGAALPRTVTLITGPSRSSDIERTVTIGVHGPRRLHIVLVGRAAGSDGEGA